MAMNRTQIVRTNGVELNARASGDPDDPALLLVMGANAPMMRWPEPFIDRLASAGRFVIRYDNRDTGASTTFPPGKPGYDIRDLASDAAGVLDSHRD